MDLVIRGGTVVTASGVYPADIGIEGEQIATIGRGLAGARTLSAEGMYVLPGAVDAHVHLEQPVGGTTSSDDFRTGTIAAACGGTTTILDFAQSRRNHSLLDTLAERRGLAEGQAVIDYGLHISILDAQRSTLAEIPQVISLGCTSFKLYMAYTDLWLDDGQLWTVLSALAAEGGLPVVHCENYQVTAEIKAALHKQGKLEPRFHAVAHPTAMEGEATGRIISLSRVTGCPVYIAHVSCREALDRIQEARQRGQRVYGETCPQYLLLTEREYLQPGFQGAKYVISPPLRSSEDQKALWGALARGDLQVVSTDHCPFFYEGQKTLGLEDFSLIPVGMPGVETRLALLYHYGVVQGRLSLSQWVAICCTMPAEIFGLAPRKGQITIGSDADLVIFDPQKKVTLQAARLHQHVDYCPYEGMEVIGYPKHVLSRGELIVEDGEFVGKIGRGQFLRRKRPQLPPLGSR